MKYFSLILVSIVVLVSACQSKKKEAELLELSKPAWLKERPKSPDYYYGIGITPKTGYAAHYEDKAKERALSDLSKQINTQIKSETSFYKMEDNHGVHEYIQSRIKATSSEFLEGYEYLDKWEDMNYMYAFYRLSKSEFYKRKELRKNEALELAYLKLKQAQKHDSEESIITALELYASSIDALSGYLNEEASIVDGGVKIDLFSEAKNGLVNIVQELELKCSHTEYEVVSDQNLEKGVFSYTTVRNNNNIANVPVSFTFSGGYLTSDKTNSDASGHCQSPSLKMNGQNQTLVASIDLVSIARQTTKNLFVRQLIKNSRANTCTVRITSK
ncbi:LPP20 family lipoprotein [Carboxylicivirga sp. N1Y90]|uniref:LPP20 family lipoprotein n=1 Tax=Carboxylicivirga fragile TaxID=3417571 RepID=UPI003D347A94|nr:LPP20 family lipoprotein [Marinilabiliaceae bacterium N1Y90]